MKKASQFLLKVNHYLYLAFRIGIFLLLYLLFLSAFYDLVNIAKNNKQLNKAKIQEVELKLKDNRCYDNKLMPQQIKICNRYREQLNSLKGSCKSILIDYIKNSIQDFAFNLNYRAIILLILLYIFIRRISKIKKII